VAIDFGLDAAAEMSHVEQAELDRLAISRTLQSLGCFAIEGRTGLPIPGSTTANASLRSKPISRQLQQA